MTDNGTTDRQPPRLSTSKVLLVTAIAACLCLAMLALLQSVGTLQIQHLLFSWWMLPALLLHFASLALFILAWHTLLSGHSTHRFSYRECLAQIGVTLTGKYLPGKIWGLLGRSYLLTRRGVSPGNALHLLIADQFLTFYSGAVAIGLGVLLIVAPAVAALAAVLVAVLSPVLLSSYQHLAGWLETRPALRNRTISQEADQPGKNSTTTTDPVTSVLEPARLLRVALVYFLHWLGLSVALALLFYPALADNFARLCLLLIIAVPAGMLTGFLALWAPAGIGVREAVMVGVLGTGVSFELAAAIALVYRLLCIGNDLLTGALALHFYTRNDPGLLGRSADGKTAS